MVRRAAATSQDVLLRGSSAFRGPTMEHQAPPTVQFTAVDGRRSRHRESVVDSSAIYAGDGMRSSSCLIRSWAV